MSSETVGVGRIPFIKPGERINTGARGRKEREIPASFSGMPQRVEKVDKRKTTPVKESQMDIFSSMFVKESVRKSDPPRFQSLPKKARIATTAVTATALFMPAIGEGISVVESIQDGVQFAQDIGTPSKLNLEQGKTYTFALAGDSLAFGVGGSDTIVDGQAVPRSFGKPLVDDLNAQSPGIAKYKVISGLSNPGISTAETIERLKVQQDKLKYIPNLVIGVSVLNKEILKDLQLDQKTNAAKPNDAKDVAKLMIAGVRTFSHNLEELEKQLETLQTERIHVLGEDAGRLQVIYLEYPGKPHEVPAIEKKLQESHISPMAADAAASLFNLTLRKSVNEENRSEKKKQIGVRSTTIILNGRIYDSEISSIDNFHPNDKGYARVAAVAKNRFILSYLNH